MAQRFARDPQADSVERIPRDLRIRTPAIHGTHDALDAHVGAGQRGELVLQLLEIDDDVGQERRRGVEEVGGGRRMTRCPRMVMGMTVRLVVAAIAMQFVRRITRGGGRGLERRIFEERSQPGGVLGGGAFAQLGAGGPSGLRIEEGDARQACRCLLLL